MKRFAEFTADIADDTVRGFGGVIERPNGQALASMLRAGVRAAGHAASEPTVVVKAWTFSVDVRHGSVLCTVQHQDHWYLATEAREAKSSRFLGRRRLDDDHSEVIRVIDGVLRSDARIGDVRWYSKEEYDARMMTIPSATKAELVAHGLSETFARFVTEGRRVSDEVSYWCDDPNETWQYYVPPQIERPRQLWSTNADPTIVATVQGRTTFLRLHHDDVKHQMIGHTEVALATHLMSQVIDAEDWEDEAATRRRLRALADRIGYRHFDALDQYESSDDPATLSELIRRLEGGAAEG